MTGSMARITGSNRLTGKLKIKNVIGMFKNSPWGNCGPT